MNEDEAFEAVQNEYLLATEKFGPFVSRHEGLAIIWEEFEGLKEKVFTKHDLEGIYGMQREAVQLAAMAIRFVVDSSP